MLVVRCVRQDDVEALFDLIVRSELGLTTLKISKDKLQRRIEDSIYAFERSAAKPQGQPYVFVLEDLAKGKIVGTSAIYSKVGGFEPFYSYKIKTSRHESEQLNVHKEIKVLHLHADHDGPTEIGSLFLAPDYWGHGHGKLLSLSRFLFMAEFPDRFEDETIAELRGVVGKDGKSPLWSALGAHFFQMDFPRAETLTSESKKFIADLMPTHPVYIPLLPEDAQAVIGDVHRNTRPARAMLEREGFEYREFIDIFDGGPTVHVATKEIKTLRQSSVTTVTEIVPQVGQAKIKMLANGRLDFRCCLGAVAVRDDGAVIDEVTALQLQIKQGDALRVAEINLKPRKKESQRKTPDSVR